jgi:hypothetical protein
MHYLNDDPSVRQLWARETTSSRFPGPRRPEAEPAFRRTTMQPEATEQITVKEIAAQLVILQRTPEGHVERLLTKLSFTSRAEVAAWVAASQPNDDRR